MRTDTTGLTYVTPEHAAIVRSGGKLPGSVPKCYQRTHGLTEAVSTALLMAAMGLSAAQPCATVRKVAAPTPRQPLTAAARERAARERVQDEVYRGIAARQAETAARQAAAALFPHAYASPASYRPQTPGERLLAHVQSAAGVDSATRRQAEMDQDIARLYGLSTPPLAPLKAYQPGAHASFSPQGSRLVAMAEEMAAKHEATKTALAAKRRAASPAEPLPGPTNAAGSRLVEAALRLARQSAA